MHQWVEFVENCHSGKKKNKTQVQLKVEQAVTRARSPKCSQHTMLETGRGSRAWTNSGDSGQCPLLIFDALLCAWENTVICLSFQTATEISPLAGNVSVPLYFLLFLQSNG